MLRANVSFASLLVPGSPFNVNVQPAAPGEAPNVQVKELPKSAPVGKSVPFKIETAGAAPGEPKVAVTGPKGQPIPCPTEQTPEGFSSRFTPVDVGPHNVAVTFADKPVPNSPFKVDAVDVSKVKVKELPQCVPVNNEVPFTIDTSESGPVQPELAVTGPLNNAVPSTVEPAADKPGYVGKFTPTEIGPHKVNVKCLDEPIPGSPFPSTALQPQPGPAGKVKVYGAGLNTGTVNKPADFTIDTRDAGPGGLGLTIDGPTEAKIECFDRGGGIFDVRYWPTEPGQYMTNVLFDDQPVPGSPFTAHINPAKMVDVSQVKVYGQGVQPTGVFSESTTDFIVDAKSVEPRGEGVTKALITSPTGTRSEAIVKNKKDGLYECLYTPVEQGPHKIDVTYEGIPVPESPFNVAVVPGCDPSRVKVYGPGLTAGQVNRPEHFTIETRGAGPGGVGLSMVGPTEPKVGCVDNQDGTLTVEYVASSVGQYEIGVTFADQPVPGSPFHTTVSETAPVQSPAANVKCYGPGLQPSGVQRGQPTKFTVDASKAPAGAPTHVAITDLTTGQTIPVEMTPQGNNVVDATYTPTKEGPTQIDVTYANEPVPNSPFRVDVQPTSGAPDVTKVKVSGPGVSPEGVPASLPVTFNVDTRGAGPPGTPVEATVTDTRGQLVKASVVRLDESTVAVTYVPDQVGPHKVDVRYAGQPVQSSPFTVNTVPSGDANNVQFTEQVAESVTVGQEVSVRVRKTEAAGLGRVTCDVTSSTGQLVKATVVDNRDGTVTVKYLPTEPGTYHLDVKFGGVTVPNGKVAQQAVGQPVQPGMVSEETVVPDQSKKIESEFHPGPGWTDASPVAKKVEETEEEILTEMKTDYERQQIQPTQLQPTEQPQQPITEDAVVPDSAKKIHAEFAPDWTDATPLATSPDSQTVTGTQLQQQTMQTAQSQVTSTHVSQQQTTTTTQTTSVIPMQPDESVPSPYHGADFCVPIGPDFNLVTAVVTTPTLKKYRPNVVDNRDGTVRVQYRPTETGPHTLEMNYAGVPLQGSPYKFTVQPVVAGKVSAFGPGLSAGLAGHPSSFTVVTKDAGPGGLGVAIEGPSKVEILPKDNKDGTVSISYTPKLPGEYKIVVKYAGQVIEGAPFFAKISAPYGEEPSKSQMTLGSQGALSLTVTETDLTNLTATIRRPSGVEEPCGLRRQPSGQLGISFTPKEVGDHMVSVFRNGQPIAGSPFRIAVGRNEIGDASKVRVGGRGVMQAMTNENNEFFVNTKDAGIGSLGMSIEGPGKVEMKCFENPGGACRVQYKPTEPGTYQLSIRYADEHIPGSPFTVNVGGQPSGHVTEKITRQQQAVTQISSVGTQCELNINLAGVDVKNLEGLITRPSGVCEPCEVVDVGNGRFTIKFVPKEIGLHAVGLKTNGLHIPGSPFQFTVGPIAGGGPHKVRAVGPGLERGEVNKPNPFTIITHEAGAGGLSLGIEGPSKAVIDFQDRHDGTNDVTYTVTEPGEYMITIKFNDQPIPDSPFKVYILPASGDSKKLHVDNLQQLGLQVNNSSQFTVDFNGAQGKLDAKVVSPSGTETDANVQQVQHDRYAVNFIPRESGTHYVHVRLNGVHVPGSPYPVQVGQVDADVSRVRAYGDGLQKGVSGQLCKFIVDTSNAGTGPLSVSISGPSRVELVSKEIDVGYEFSYTPLAPGDYFITIKYAGNTHVPGSPFKAHIEGTGQPSSMFAESRMVIQTVRKTTTTTTTSRQTVQQQQQQQEQIVRQTAVQPIQSMPPDASKVQASGAGLQKAFVNQECSFIVDGSQTGYNMLVVGIAGPQVPCEQLHALHLGRLKYVVKYSLSQPGQYQLMVKWGDQHIPGSPFSIVAQ